MAGEHPERLDVSVDRCCRGSPGNTRRPRRGAHISRSRAPLEPRRRLDGAAWPGRRYPAAASAHRKRRSGRSTAAPTSTVETTVKPAKRYQARLYLKIGRFQREQAEDVDDGDQLAFAKAQIEDRRHQRDVLQPDALAEEATSASADEGGEQHQIGRLRADNLLPARRRAPRLRRSPRDRPRQAARSAPARRTLARSAAARKRAPSASASSTADGERRRRFTSAASGGVSNCLATRRALFLIARVALVMVIDALDTASMSAPTLNGSRMFLPLNCAANCGRVDREIAVRLVMVDDDDPGQDALGVHADEDLDRAVVGRARAAPARSSRRPTRGASAPPLANR